MRTYDGMTAGERAAARRRRLMDAGLELFHTQGYPGTSIRAVLRRSGLQDRYFGESFPSLDALMAAVLAEIQDEEAAGCRAAATGPGTRRERARGMLRVLAAGVADDPRKGRVKLVESLAAGPLAANERRRGMWNLARMVEELLLEDPPGPGTHTGVMALAIVGGVQQILLNWADGTLPLSREDVVEQGLRLFEAVAAFDGGPSARR
ncbi:MULTISPECIES: TetR/AcrR family transcriptional regulator [unclassified Streptomyces]|uniref:TetR/AcrR family transcriptional regulator n=1 Tax=unclassified Streptomyces TaxID=2593676 RepID=UPI003813DCBD